MEEISDRLRKVRLDSGLSVREFADLIISAGYEISHGTVSAYELGSTRALADYVAVVGKVFNKSPRWLLHGEGIEDDAGLTDAEKRLAMLKEIALGDMDTVLEYFYRLKPDPGEGKSSA